MNKEEAADMVSCMLDSSDKLARSVQAAKLVMANDDFLNYRNQVSAFMADTLYVQLTRIFNEHPDLKPDEWDW